jgi:hypothetical protein
VITAEQLRGVPSQQRHRRMACGSCGSIRTTGQRTSQRRDHELECGISPVVLGPGGPGLRESQLPAAQQRRRADRSLREVRRRPRPELHHRRAAALHPDRAADRETPVSTSRRLRASAWARTSNRKATRRPWRSCRSPAATH